MALSGNEFTKVAGYMAGVGKRQAFTAKVAGTNWYKIALEEHDTSFLHVTSNETDVVSYAFMMGC